MDYDNTNSGVLFKNESDNEKAPMYKGKINVDGKEYELAAWLREAKSGSETFLCLTLPLAWLREAKSGKGKFLSLKVQEPRQKAEKKTATFDDIESDVPF